MRRFYPLILTGALCFLASLSYGQYDVTHTVVENPVINTSITYDAGQSITYTSEDTNNSLTISDNSTVIIDLGEDTNTLSLRGLNTNGSIIDALLGNGVDGLNITVDEGSTLKIIGGLDAGKYTDLYINGTMIITGDVTCFGSGGHLDMEVFMGDNGVLAIGGDANFRDSKGQNQQNVYVSGTVLPEGGNFDEVNKGSDPFSTDLAINLVESKASIDLWTDTTLVVGDKSNGIISTYLLNGMTLSNASGFYNKYLKVTVTGFNEEEVTMNNQLTAIVSQVELETRINSIKWEVKDEMVKKSLDNYHNKNTVEKKESYLRDLDSDSVSSVKTYLTKTRKIQIEFVENIVDAGVVIVSGGRKNGIQDSGEIPIENAVSEDLPVVLSHFSTTLNNEKQVVLNWTTATEINNSHFEILRSIDKVTWNVIESIEGAGNTNYAIDYEFIDEEPLATAYYKLIQYDFDGKNETFGPLYVTLSNDENVAFETNIYPNAIGRNEMPKIQIQGLINGADIGIQIYNKNGQIVYKENIDGDLASTTLLKHLNFPTSLPSGMYYVVVKSGKQLARSKLLLR